MGRLGLLTLGLAFAGCESQPTLPPEEVTFEELNLALAKIDESGRGFPRSVEELIRLGELRGKVLPELPPGFHLAIDKENKSVVVLIDDQPGVQ